MRKGRLFEEIVTLVEHALGAGENTKVSHDVKLLDRNGNKRQIDVYIVSEVSGHQICIAIECKDHKRKIELSDIESFVQKTRYLPVDKCI